MSQYTELTNWYERHGEGFITTKEIVWDIGKENSGLSYEVPAGFSFEVSIPKLVFWLNPYDRRYLQAACLHDHILKHGWDRLTAAAIFHQALKADGVGWFTRLQMWLAVSLWKWR